MRRFLYILGALTLALIIAAGTGLGVLFYKGQVLDTESKSFVDSSVPAIAANWSKQQLLERATPELRESIKPEELNILFEKLAQLGPLTKYDGATGEAAMSYFAGSGSSISASYLAKAQFQNGTASFRMLLTKRDGRWMIHGFHVDLAPSNRTGQGT